MEEYEQVGIIGIAVGMIVMFLMFSLMFYIIDEQEEVSIFGTHFVRVEAEQEDEVFEDKVLPLMVEVEGYFSSSDVKFVSVDGERELDILDVKFLDKLNSTVFWVDVPTNEIREGFYS